MKAKSDFSNSKIDRACYAAESILNDITKVAMLFVIGFCCGEKVLFISTLLTYMILRPFLGGIHKNTYWGCFFSTLGLLLLAMALVLYIPMREEFGIVLTFFICAIGLTSGPIESAKKKRLNEESRKQKRKVALIIHMVIAVVYMLVQMEKIRKGILAGLFLEHSQIIYLSTKQVIGGRTKWKKS